MKEDKKGQQNFAPAKSYGRKKRNDVILIGVILAVLITAGVLFSILRPQGDKVTVTVGTKFFGEYSLSEDKTVEIISDAGRNLLVIMDGKADITEADCPDGVCAKHRPIGRVGETIVCLPNQVVVRVVGNESGKVPDVSVR